MSTKNSKISIAFLVIVFAVLALVGGRVINASAAHLSDLDGRGSSQPASSFDTRHFREVEFVDLVQAIGDQSWQIGGRVILVLPTTEIENVLAVGDLVEVEAFVLASGSLVAHEIELFSIDMDDNDNVNDDGDVDSCDDDVDDNKNDDNGNDDDDECIDDDDNSNGNGNDNDNNGNDDDDHGDDHDHHDNDNDDRGNDHDDFGEDDD